MDSIQIRSKNDEYPWWWDFASPFVWIPKEDVLLITGYYRLMKTPEEQVVNELPTGINHESLHRIIFKLEGEKATNGLDQVNYQIEEWLGWSHISWGKIVR